MKILINDDEIQFSGNTLDELLTENGFINNSGIAVAVNETVIARKDWEAYSLKEGDSILIITLSQGG